jgi:methyl-accepting chemotaxis protein
MTTKLKIITGFTFMFVILAVVSFFGYRGLNNASDQIVEFSRISTQNTALSNSVGFIQESAYYLEKFMRLSDGKDMDASLAAQENTLRSVEETLPTLVTPAGKEALGKVKARLEEYIKALQQMKSSLVPWYADYQQIIGPNFTAAEKALGDVGDMALRVNNSAILGQVNDVWRMLVTLDKSLALFRETATRERAAAIDALLEQAAPLNERFRSALITDAGKRAFAAYQKEFDEIVRTYQKHKSGVLQAEEILAVAYTWDTELEGTLNTASQQADADQDQTEKDVFASNASAQTAMLVASAVGLLLGALAACCIIFSLISILNKISAFCGAVANGEFDRNATIREKGEIGRVVAAVLKIPATLKDILSDYLELEKKMAGGALTLHIDPSRYTGGFATLVNGTNSILSRLTTVIDNIPSPVVMLNRDARIEYVNAAGKAVAGSDYQGKSSKQMFNFDDDGTPADALKQAA